ncbi:MAG: ABC transporter permease [Tessaracoccus sp.]
MSSQMMSIPTSAPRPGMRAWLKLCVCEAKMTARDTAGLLVPLMLPILILITSASGASQQVIADGRTALDLFVLPLVFVMIASIIGVTNMPSMLAYYRRSGILRRLATTPLSPFMVLAAQVVVSFLQALLGIALSLGVAMGFFGASLPARPLASLGALVLVMFAMYGVGMIIASLAPTPNAAVALGFVGFLGLGALGGMFGGREALPDALATVGEFLPFGAGVEVLAATWAGAPVDGSHLIALLASVVVGTVVSAFFFRWE